MPQLRRFVRSMTFRHKETPTYVTPTATEAPKLQFDEVFSPTMSLSGFSSLFIDPASADKQKDASPVGSAGSPKLRPNEHRTPTRQPSAPNNRIPSSLVPNGDLAQDSPQPDTPNSASTDMKWTSSGGRAITGTSGKVIEKLNADVDRLKLDNNLATVRLEEEVRRSEAARTALTSLRVSNENLISMHELEKTVLAKKERKVEELKADLEAEKSRREKAESETKVTQRERDDAVEKLTVELAEERERSRKATVQYEVLSSSWKGLEATYKRQMSKLQADFKTVREIVVENKSKLAQHEVVVEQLQQENEKAIKAKEELVQDFEEYQVKKEDSIRELRERAERNEGAIDQALEEMNIVTGEMRYVVNVQRNARSTG